MAIEIPFETAAGPSTGGAGNYRAAADEKGRTRWKTVGKVNSDLELSNGAIEVPLKGIPSRGARIFRLLLTLLPMVLLLMMMMMMIVMRIKVYTIAFISSVSVIVPSKCE